MIHIEQFVFNSFQTRCSVVWDESGKCAITDPGMTTAEETDTITGFISSKGLKPECIMLTHGHFDHVTGVAQLSRFYGGIPVYMHPADRFTLENNDFFCRMFGAPKPDRFDTEDIGDGSMIKVGTMTFEVLETPGHTVGGVCFLERKEKVLFSGDTLFAGAIGRTDHPGGDYDQIMKSIFEKLMILEGDITVIPGHGPQTDIATERMTNPFLMPFNEPFED
ncbi:MAG: MBL fold metallo-hydrolase [Bacteroidales bacterium]|nr:MBL fold metallo-hydrolase [Bacteroidales bacterium]MBQ6688510.1 MBL fold metallo-hydrolase [Bacteroidales bacterium]